RAAARQFHPYPKRAPGGPALVPEVCRLSGSDLLARRPESLGHSDEAIPAPDPGLPFTRRDGGDPRGAGRIDLERPTGSGLVRADVHPRGPSLRGNRRATSGRDTDSVTHGPDQWEGSKAAGHPIVAQHSGLSAKVVAPDRPGTGLASVPE